MKRSASAVWKGGLQDGKGTVSTEAGALSNTPYSAAMRFGDEKGTNPEELVAAAHAACYSMALSLYMTLEGMAAPESIESSCVVTFEKLDTGWTVTSSHLTTKVKSAGADPAKFTSAANKAKEGCPISRLLKTNITLDAKLV